MPDLDLETPLDATAQAQQRDLRQGRAYSPDEMMKLLHPERKLANLKLKPGDEPSLRRSVLTDAIAVVTGAREDTYGGPESSFSLIASFWSAYLAQDIAPHDVAALLALLKIARLKRADGKHRDSWLDLAGYAACGAECALGGEDKEVKAEGA